MKTIFVMVAIIAGCAIFGWMSRSREKYERKRLQRYIEKRDKEFRESFCKGRQWLADFIAECNMAIDDRRENYLRFKKRPAQKAAEVVREIKTEKRELASKLKFVEYQLRSYEEYFPFLTDYKEIILDERIELKEGNGNIRLIQSVDPVQIYLEKSEYRTLSSAEKNQLALDRYLSRRKSKWEIGRQYERFLGYLHEKSGWKVTYYGAIKGFDDFGRDLICEKDSFVRVIQAKCWSKEKIIREKHIFQLFGSFIHYRKIFKDKILIRRGWGVCRQSEQTK